MVFKPHRLGPVRIGTFLEGLCQDAPRSPGEKALASQVISRHRAEIEDYLRETEKTGSLPLARSRREALDRYAIAPRNVAFDEGSASVRMPSFRLAPSRRHSLTLPSRHRTARLVGYLLAALTSTLLLWGASRLADTASRLIDEHEANLALDPASP